jgi:hypothetical protein
MRTIVIISLILLSGCNMSKQFHEQHPFVMTQFPIDTVRPAGTKAELFVKANLWMVDQFKSAKSVIQYSDKEAGVIKGKYLLASFPLEGFFGHTIGGDYTATITITVADNLMTLNIIPIDLPRMDYPQEKMDADINALYRRFKDSFK